MGRLKALIISAAAVCCAILSGTSTSAGSFIRGAELFSAGVFGGETRGESKPDKRTTSDNNGTSSIESVESSSGTSTESETSGNSSEGSTVSDVSEPPSVTPGRVIVKNRTENVDDTDYSIYTKVSGEVERCNFGYFDDPNIVTLKSGAQIRNLTEEDNGVLKKISEEMPWDELDINADEPLVLIYHTHSCESFLPFGEVYDEDYPVRSVDCSKNITAVGDAICEALSRRGISSVHDCTVHDEPMFTGAYYRSADTMLEILDEYPTIKIAIDIHRDGIINADGSITAPIAEINGKTAAQFMIITGCDSEDTPLPDFRENLKLACLIQNAAEDAYPSLARPIMFDYRSYNQPLFEGNLLIEIGSQANTFEEAEYCGELLGNSIARAINSYL